MSDVGEQSQSPTLPITEETFRFPLRERIISWFGLLFFGGLAGLCFFTWLWPHLGPPGWGRLLGVFCFLTFALGTLVAIALFESYIKVDSERITSKWLGWRPISLNWKEIRTIREHDRQLELRAGPSDPVVKVNYLILDFTRLRDIILLAAPKRVVARDEADLFHMGLPITVRREMAGFSLVLVGSLFLIVLSAAGYAEGMPLLASCLVVLSLCSLVPYTLDWFYLTVHEDKLVLSGFGRCKAIEYSEMSGLDVETFEFDHAGVSAVWIYLRLTLKNGKILKLKSFRHQTLRIRQLIESMPAFKSRPSSLSNENGTTQE